MKTISVDFDGVIHAYSKGWQNGECYDPPMGGAIYGLQALMEEHAVFILSTREPQKIVEWFALHAPEIKTKIIDDRQPFWNEKGVIGVTNQKLAAMVYIDDRSYLFKDWATVVGDKSIFANYPKSIIAPKPVNPPVHVQRGPSDPICTRVSVGGNDEVGYYCTFRGSVESSVIALRASLAAMEAMQAAGADPEVDRRFKELGAS